MTRHLAIALSCGLLATSVATAQDAFERRGFSVSITEPESGGFVSGKTPIKAEVKAADERDIVKVEFEIDDETVFIDEEAPYQTIYDFGPNPESHVIRAIAHHVDGLTTSAAVVTKKVVLHYQLDVNRVVLNATVMDGKNTFVLDLGPEDFRVRENGQDQRIIDLWLEERPITLALLIDTSGSMQEQMSEVHTAAAGFIDQLSTDDQALVIDFDEKVFLLQDLTHDKELLSEAVRSTYAQGQTAIYDALHAAFRKIANLDGRRAIVLLSDGRDTDSRLDYKQVITEARTADVIIYAIGLGAGFLDSSFKSELKSFANETGGRAFFPGNARELAEVYERIARELRSQYYVTYESTTGELDGAWRTVKVNVTSGDYKVRTRKGYFAVPR